MKNFEQIKAQSDLLDESLKEQMRGVFERLTAEVRIKSVVDEKNPKSVELTSFLKEIVTLSDKLKLELYELGEDAGMEAELQCAGRLPVLGLYNGENRSTGIRFYGIPGGKEINSFVLAIYNVGSSGQPMEEAVRERIGTISKPTDLKVCVSLGCHHCAELVVACQRIASLNDNVKASMIDATLYPDLVEQYEIERVPVLIIDDSRQVLGGKNMEEILELLEE